MAKNFKDLSEQEILALAISSEAEEDEHRRELIEEYRRRFGEHIPLIRQKQLHRQKYRRCSAGPGNRL